MIRRFLSGLVVVSALAFASPATAQPAARPAPAPASTLSAAQKAEVRALVRDYIKQNPEVVQEALDELKRREEVREQARIAAMRPRLEGDPRDFSLGPRNAPVTIVEFFDYRCPYCHSAMEWVFETMRRNPRTVRVVFKEFPVLGDPSVDASRAAVAAIRQGKYVALHKAMMTHRGNLTSEQIDVLARRAGLDVARMRRDMGDTAVFNHLKANHELAAEARVEGTPAFMINGQWLRGWDQAEADRMLAAALRERRAK